ncbi:MAG: hypothetical protein RL081_1465 [Pseudomonadota bacterium]
MGGLCSGRQWPGMAMNANFDAAILAAVPDGKKLVLLCRSGVRSIAAAKRATELGLEAYNILEGFEGDPDAHAHRGNKGGWRMRGLPWFLHWILAIRASSGPSTTPPAPMPNYCTMAPSSWSTLTAWPKAPGAICRRLRTCWAV